MRPDPKHTPPAGQASPPDNTSRYVVDQVMHWRNTGRLIHPQIAMEISSWWASPGTSNPHMTAFGSDGTYEDGLLDEVWFELRSDRRKDMEEASIWALEALEAYVIGIPQ